MKFSEMLCEYLDLRDQERKADEWEPIDRGRLRSERQQELLGDMDALIDGVQEDRK